jgi:hypothetical protein
MTRKVVLAALSVALILVVAGCGPKEAEVKGEATPSGTVIQPPNPAMQQMQQGGAPGAPGTPPGPPPAARTAK